MCLALVKYACNAKGIFVAYKVFELEDNKLFGFIKGPTGLSYWEDTHYRLNRWYKSIGEYDDVEQYELGFHAFQTLCDAQSRAKMETSYGNPHVVCQVHLRNLLAVGEQFSATCFVAKEMKIVRRMS